MGGRLGKKRHPIRIKITPNDEFCKLLLKIHQLIRRGSDNKWGILNFLKFATWVSGAK